MLVAETEYAGLLDWVKRKLGIGYARVKTFSSRELAREASAILTGLGIKHYIRKRGEFYYDLYVEKDKVEQAVRALEGLKKPMIKLAERERELKVFRMGTMVPLFAAIAAVPLIALLLMRAKR